MLASTNSYYTNWNKHQTEQATNKSVEFLCQIGLNSNNDEGGILTKALTSLANLGHVVTNQAGEVGPCSAWLTWDNMSMTLRSKIDQVWNSHYMYKIHLK